jgi:hypothetical protein
MASEDSDASRRYTAASLYAAFSAPEARRLLKRFGWRYKPPNMEGGSIWPNPNSAYRRANAGAAAFQTRRSLNGKWPPARIIATNITTNDTRAKLKRPFLALRVDQTFRAIPPLDAGVTDKLPKFSLPSRDRAAL